MSKASNTRDEVQKAAYDSKIKALEDQAQKLRHINDNLRNEVFFWTQRDTRIAENMGFVSAEELQAAMSARPEAFRKDFIEGSARTIEGLEERVREHIRLDAASAAGLADAAKEIDQLKAENASLQERADAVAGERDAVARERDELKRRVEELEGALAGRAVPEDTGTGLLTPATTKKRPHPTSTLPATTTPPPARAPSPLTITPATPRLPPLTLSLSPESDDADADVLRLELRALHAQYEVLRAVKERAERKHRVDYARWTADREAWVKAEEGWRAKEQKWRADYGLWHVFKDWMFDEKPKGGKARAREGKGAADGVVDGREPNMAKVKGVRERYVHKGQGEAQRRGGGGGGGSKDNGGGDHSGEEEEKKQKQTPALPDTFEKADGAAPQSSLTAKLLAAARETRAPDTPPVQDTSAAKSTAAAPGPPPPVPVSAVAQGKKRAGELGREAPEPAADAEVEAPSSSPSRKRQRYDDSSETEEESQALPPVLGSQPGVRRLVPMPDGTYVRRGYGPYPSDAGPSTNPSTNTNNNNNIDTKPAEPPSPAPSTPRKSTPGTPGSRKSKRSPGKSSPPSSRLSTPRRRKDRLVGSPAGTPTKRTRERGEKEKEKENPSAQGRVQGRERPKDYSAYKGRGRYAANKSKGSDETINAVYEVDAARNDGVSHAFEEVVRDKERRKQFHGGDCECCRDYYKAVGKLPPPPQAPLWRSPRTTPTKAKSATASGRKHLADASSVPNSPRKRRERPESDADEDEDADAEAAHIAAHKQRISRHRQQWERPKTPPGYWEIAFPDTQEVAAINERAREMHEQKRARVEEEASRGGRYKKRKT